MQYIMKYQSPVGMLSVGSDGMYITGLWIENQRYFPTFTNAQYVASGEIPVLKLAKYWLDQYFSGGYPEIEPEVLKPQGTAFQMLIWELLMQIPYGNTVSYKELADHAAKKLGKEHMSAQAVGNAVGRNPVSILIPCHRVIGADGSLTGFAAGIEIKKWLLQFETDNNKMC